MGAEASQQHQLLLQAQQQRQHPPQQTRRYCRGSSGGGVQGGHIVRSTGRKDRHSKVCTAKGPRDRRVRLSAHTAIQFYDVQDRLGYDRPSKAVDWLIKNAKASIDGLAQLPPWHPTTNITTAAVSPPGEPSPLQDSSAAVEEHQQQQAAYGFGGSSSSILPPSLDTDSIADTIKSFFPMANAATDAAVTAPTPSSAQPAVAYQTSFAAPDLLSRTTSHAQDLRLSLQSFQESPTLFHHHHHQQQQSTPPAHPHGNQSLFSALAFDIGTASGNWAEHSQRMIPWSLTESGGGGYLFNVSPFAPAQAQALPPLQQLLWQQSQVVYNTTQRESLQSSNLPSARAWSTTDHHHGIIMSADHAAVLHHPSFTASGTGNFAGFQIPAQIPGDDEEEHEGGGSSKPSSASSASHH